MLGKIVGGGLPVGAYGGRADMMKQGAAGRAGVSGGHAVGQPAGDGRRPGDAAGTARSSALRRAGAAGCAAGRGADAGRPAAGVPHCLNRVGSMWTLFFTDGPVTDYDSAKTSDTARFARFFWAMMDRGIYLPCSQFEAAFNSVLHGEEEIEEPSGVRERLRRSPGPENGGGSVVGLGEVLPRQGRGRRLLRRFPLHDEGRGPPRQDSRHPLGWCSPLDLVGIMRS